MRGTRKGQGTAQDGRSLAVHEAGVGHAVAAGEREPVVGLGSRRRGRDERSLVHGQRTGDEGDVVVRRGQAGGRNHVAAGVDGSLRVAPVGEGAAEEGFALPRDEACEGYAVASREGLPVVGLDGGGRGDGQRGLVHRQGAGREGEGVVGGRQPRRRDGVGPRIDGALAGAAVDETAGKDGARLAVHKTGIADAGAVDESRGIIGLAGAVRGHRERRRVDVPGRREVGESVIGGVRAGQCGVRHQHSAGLAHVLAVVDGGGVGERDRVARDHARQADARDVRGLGAVVGLVDAGQAREGQRTLQDVVDAGDEDAVEVRLAGGDRPVDGVDAVGPHAQAARAAVKRIEGRQGEGRDVGSVRHADVVADGAEGAVEVDLRAAAAALEIGDRSDRISRGGAVGCRQVIQLDEQLVDADDGVAAVLKGDVVVRRREPGRHQHAGIGAGRVRRDVRTRDRKRATQHGARLAVHQSHITDSAVVRGVVEIARQLRVVVRPHGEGSLADRQGAVHVGDHVVAGRQAEGGDDVAACVHRALAGAAVRDRPREHGGGLAVHEARVGHPVAAGVGQAVVGLGVARRRDGERDGADRERSGGESDGVVVRSQSGGRDGICACVDRALRRTAVGERAAERRGVLGVDETDVGHAVAAREGKAVVILGSGRGRHGQARLVHRQESVDVADLVVRGVEGAARRGARHDGVRAAGDARRRGRADARQRDAAEGLAVLQADHAVSGKGDGLTVGLDDVGGGDGQGGPADGQRPVGVGDGIVRGGQARGRDHVAPRVDGPLRGALVREAAAEDGRGLAVDETGIGHAVAAGEGQTVVGLGGGVSGDRQAGRRDVARRRDRAQEVVARIGARNRGTRDGDDLAGSDVFAGIKGRDAREGDGIAGQPPRQRSQAGDGRDDRAIVRLGDARQARDRQSARSDGVTARDDDIVAEVE